MQTFTSSTILRFFIAVFLITTLATAAHALPSPSSAQVEPGAPKVRSPIEFRGRSYNKLRREFNIDTRDILFNKANDLRRAQRFRATQRKKRDADATDPTLP
ncbi:hypothetical protein J3R30DRAFT_565884 [Lentinula aciculospora]|uniref:Uncharacterized protein n=1 Tax=Lentinula aciculospora TaxID=153920 RepID=A0A9W9A6E0_9AGAR|nr:hypothetical protein J3R30DRAFT_565884 [Lentinula aciculospora]